MGKDFFPRWLDEKRLFFGEPGDDVKGVTYGVQTFDATALEKTDEALAVYMFAEAIHRTIGHSEKDAQDVLREWLQANGLWDKYKDEVFHVRPE